MKVGDVEVVAFGWSSELEEKHEAIHILGLRMTRKKDLHPK